MARVYVGGPSGSGKTVACKTVAQELGISCLTGSEIMMRASGVSTRDDLEQLPESTKNELRLHAFESYYQSTPNLVIDGHFYLTETDIKYFDAYLFVEIDSERLIEIRNSDDTRQRSTDRSVIDQEIVQLHERVDKLESEFGIRVIRIKNDSTMDELTRSIEGAYLSAFSDETRRELFIRGKERR